MAGKKSKEPAKSAAKAAVTRPPSAQQVVAKPGARGTSATTTSMVVAKAPTTAKSTRPKQVAAKAGAKQVGKTATTKSTRSAETATAKQSVKSAAKRSARIVKTVSREPAPKSTVQAAAGRFEAEGPVVWAVLAPMPAAALEEHVVSEDRRTRYLDLDDDDEPRTWCVVAGGKQHAALVETMLGSDCGDRDVAKALSKQLGKPVYSVGFSGYDDPDHGLPYILRYDDGKEGLIWMAPSYDDELGEPETVAGPRGVPCNDPLDFAKALGCDLSAYRR